MRISCFDGQDRKWNGRGEEVKAVEVPGEVLVISIGSQSGGDWISLSDDQEAKPRGVAPREAFEYPSLTTLEARMVCAEANIHPNF